MTLPPTEATQADSNLWAARVGFYAALVPVLGMVLLLGFCVYAANQSTDEERLEREALLAAQAQLVQPVVWRVVRSEVRGTLAACGEASGKRFTYRPNSLTVEGAIPSTAFEAHWDGWCRQPE